MTYTPTHQSLQALATWVVSDRAESTQGQAIEVYRLATDARKTDIDALIVAAIHGDELESWQCIQLWMSQVNDDPGALQDRSVRVIPVMNPDGWAVQTRTNAHGVDLNRNFPTQTWEASGEGTPYYCGSSPGSEQETQFFMQLLAQYAPKLVVSIHTPYRVINYDGPALELAQVMARHNQYDVVADIGYPTPGSMGTYVGVERQIPIITLELPEGAAYTPNEAQANSQALTAVIQAVV